MIQRILAVTVVALASGCGSMPFSGPPTYVPQPAAGQDVVENPHAGGYSLQSRHPGSVVRVQQMVGDNLEEHGALFKVIVLSTGPEPLPFGLGSISAHSGRTPVAVIDHAKVRELEEEKKSSGDAMGSLMNAGAVLGGILSAAVTGYNGGPNMSHSQMEAASQSIAGGMVSSMEASNKATEGARIASDARLELFSLVALQDRMLQPGDVWGGYFIVESKRFTTEETTIEVRMGADTHQFRFKPKLF